MVMFGLSVISITACNYEIEKPIKDNTTTHDQGVSISDANVEPSSKKLTEVAGHSNFPVDEKMVIAPVADYAIDFVGRYYAKVNCNDGFAPCSAGTAEFVLTLLADGTVYRSIIQHGKVFTFKNEIQDAKATYRKDHWEVNPARTELIVHRKEGVDIYYDIQDNLHLVMNVEKTRRSNPAEKLLKLPTVSYVLKKDSEKDT